MLRDKLDIHVVAFERPRAALVDLLGESHQGCPVLVLAAPELASELCLPVKKAQGYAFLDDDKAIGMYLSRVYGVSRPAHN